nr:putative transposase (putative), gypsy type [Tanacetum cinerariifolium]
MSAITDVRCVLTQEELDTFCNTFHISEEVHLVLPNQDDTMHERPTGKIRLYTRLFDFANFRYVPLCFHPCFGSYQTSVERLFDKGGSGTQTKKGDLLGVGQMLISSRLLRLWILLLRRLLAGAVLNAKVGVTNVPALPFATASVSTTPEHEDDGHTDSMAEPNLHTIGALPSTPAMMTATIITSMVDSTLIAKEKTVKPFLFSIDSSSAGGADPNTGIFQILLAFFASVRGMQHYKLFTEFNVGAAHQMSLSAEVRMQAEYNVKERRRLKSVIEEKDELLKAREEEIESLKARLLLKEAEATEAIHLRAEASNFKSIEKSLREEVDALRERKVILEKERNALDVKVIELATSAVSKECELTDLNTMVTSVKSQNDSLVDQVHELEVAVYENYGPSFGGAVLPHLLTTISGHRWLLTHGMELAIAKCLHSLEYISALKTAISKAIKKGMQDGLAAGITHGKEGRVLTDVAAYNPSVKANYIFAMRQFQNVNFPLLAELRSNKDASVETIIEVLRLEEPVDEKLRLNELQPSVEQLMVLIYSSLDRVIIGATALSLALDASSSRVQNIRENIANHRSVLCDAFILLAEPFSTAALTGMEGTSNGIPATAITTTLSTTLALTSIVNRIFIDDYEFVDTDDQAVAGEDDASFPNVNDMELRIP